MNKIWITYRADDDPGGAGRLYDHLAAEFGSNNVILGLEGGIASTAEPEKAIAGIVSNCDVVLAVIGPHWLAARDDSSSKAPRDLAEIGIAKALRAKRPVIPVLISGAKMPRAEQMPQDLRPIIHLHAIRLDHGAFRAGCEGLARELREILSCGESWNWSEDTRINGPNPPFATAGEDERPPAYVCGLSDAVVGKAVEQANWETIKNGANSRAFRDHLARFPGGAFAEQALARLEQIVWERSSARSEKKEIEAYLAQFPSGAHCSEASSLLTQLEDATQFARTALERSDREKAAWAAASSANTISAYASFISEWPAGPYATFSRERMKELKTDRRVLWLAIALGIPGLLIGVHGLVRSLLPTVAAFVQEWQSRPVFREPEMVTVPNGEFVMGSPIGEEGRHNDEGPQHKVVIEKPFQLGKYEVTFAEWDVCVSEGGCKQKPSANGWGRGARPVIYVSWDDAQQYIIWLSRRLNTPYRLPTEAEWEYAARAGSLTRYEFSDTISKAQAQFATDKTAEVGSFKPNAFGLYDMHGNVWEWVQDCYRDTYAGAPIDGSASTLPCTEQGHVVRGGSWYNAANYLRSAARDADTADMRYDILGFRLARTLQP